MTNAVQGKIAELRITQDLLSSGYEVYTPVLDGGLVDLVAIKNSNVLKIQVKSVSSSNGRAILPLQKQRNHPTQGVKYHHYTPEEIDLFALHVCDLDKIAYIKTEEVYPKKAFTFRLEPSKNGQTKGINLLEDYITPP